MKATDQHTKTSSNKTLQDVGVNITYSSKKITVYSVRIKEGNFIVIHYPNKNSPKPDTEVFWEARAQSISNHSPEFKIANSAVEKFLKLK
jgi:hypothetical protein